MFVINDFDTAGTCESNIQGVYKRMVRFQKLTRNKFLVNFWNHTILL